VDTMILAEEARVGDPIAPAGRQALRTREERALALYRRRGGAIREIGPSLYSCPSQDGKRRYEVHYPVEEGELEHCSCRDHKFRGRACIHIYAVAISAAKNQRHHPTNHFQPTPVSLRRTHIKPLSKERRAQMRAALDRLEASPGLVL
jgi:hypothetical protein